MTDYSPDHQHSQDDQPIANWLDGGVAIETRSSDSQAVLLVNADDWGQSVATTDRITECALRGAISSVSAMMFMEDSERAASSALHHKIDAGLHLNLSTPFSSKKRFSRLTEHQYRVCRYLRSHRFAPAIYNPRLASSFEYVVDAQLDEFERLYGDRPSRIDGHHHMHLCANVTFRQLLPAGTTVRRNFSLGAKEKSYANRLYRRWQDRRLSRRHSLADFFFSIQPLDQPQRFAAITSLARRFNIEIETHPLNPEEYKFLMQGRLQSSSKDVAIAPRYLLRSLTNDHKAHE